MCWFLYKEQGQEFNIEEFKSEIENKFEENPDGCGVFLRNPKGELKCYKYPSAYEGFVDFETVWKAILDNNKKENAFGVHFRLTSRGNISKENTHPIECNNFYIIHNGTLRSEEIKKELSKDIRRVHSDTYCLGKIIERDNPSLYELERICFGTNKVLILYKDKELFFGKKLGSYLIDSKGNKVWISAKLNIYW